MPLGGGEGTRRALTAPCHTPTAAHSPWGRDVVSTGPSKTREVLVPTGTYQRTEADRQENTKAVTLGASAGQSVTQAM